MNKTIEAHVISKTIAYGNQRWRSNNDSSWSVLAFGTSGPNQNQHWMWLSVPTQKVPKEVRSQI